MSRNELLGRVGRHARQVQGPGDLEREQEAAERRDELGRGLEGVAEAILTGGETDDVDALEGVERFNAEWAEQTGTDASMPSPTDTGLDGIIAASNRASARVVEAHRQAGSLPPSLRPSVEEQHRAFFLEEGTEQPEAEQSPEPGTEQSSVDDIMASLNRTPQEEAELAERLGLNEPDEPEDYWYDEDEDG